MRHTIHIIASLFAAFTFIATTPIQPTNQDRDYLAAILENAITYVHERYVNPEVSDYRSLYYGAISGMLAALGDEHTSFLGPDALKALEESISSRLTGGLGIHIRNGEEYPVILTPMPNTPASHAGLQPQDRIISIDSVSTHKRPLEEVIQKLRGQPGEAVTIEIERQGLRHEVTIIRAEIRIPSLHAQMIRPKIGIIRLYNFSQTLDTELQEGFAKLKSEGMEKLIIDVRNNGGGLLHAAFEISNRFICSGTILSTEGRFPFGRQDYVAETDDCIFPSIKLVTLVNQGTASAAEILAGALQDTGRSVLIGTRTFGKGSVQDVHQFNDSSYEDIALRMTIQLYYTAGGKIIHRKGITPDILVQTQEPTLEDLYALMKLDKHPQKEIWEKEALKKEHGNHDLLDKILKSLSDDRVMAINPTFIKKWINQRTQRGQTHPIYDIEIDPVLKKALEYLDDASQTSILGSTKPQQK